MASEDKQETKKSADKCDNCGAEAVASSDGRAANKAYWCADCLPDNIEP